MVAFADDRHAKVLATAERWAGSALKHREKEARMLAKGKEGQARLARTAAEKNEARRDKCLRDADALAGPSARAAALRKHIKAANAKIKRDAEREVREAAMAPPPPMTEKERRLAQRREQERQRAVARVAAAEARARKEAQVSADTRTAAGQREIEVRGVVGQRRAIRKTHGVLIQRTPDRTLPRIRAIEKIDTLWHEASAGMLQGVNLMANGGGGGARRTVFQPEGNAEALQRLDRLKARLGPALYELVIARVVEGATFELLHQRGMGTTRQLGAGFLHALDLAARHFGYEHDPQPELSM